MIVLTRRDPMPKPVLQVVRLVRSAKARTKGGAQPAPGGLGLAAQT